MGSVQPFPENRARIVPRLGSDTPLSGAILLEDLGEDEVREIASDRTRQIITVSPTSDWLSNQEEEKSP
jgi:hypothetical protein